MNTTLTLRDFAIDTDTKFTVAVHHQGIHIGDVLFDFEQGPNEAVKFAFFDNQFLACVTTTKIAYEAACMIDSHFTDDPDSEPYSVKVIQA